MKMLVLSCVATIAVASVLPAWAEDVYQMTGNVSDGIDLVGGGYATDRLNGPASADANLGGTVTHDATLTKEHPFQIFGFGKSLTFTSETTLWDVPVKLLNAPGVTTKSGWNFRYSPKIRGGLEVCSPGQMLIFNGLTFCGTEAVPSDFVLNGVTATIAANTVLGTVDGDAGFYLTNATYKVNGGYNFQLGSMKSPGRTGMRVSMVLESSTFESGGTLTLMQDVAGSNAENCFVTIGTGSVVKATYITHQGGDYSRIRFVGGRCVATASSGGVFHVYGFSYNGGWPSPHITVEGVAGNPIDVEIASNLNVADGSKNRKIDFVGNGGFVKRGAGILTWTRVGCDYPWDSSIVSLCTYTGDTIVKGGGIKQAVSGYQPGRGGLVLEASGSTFDLNGISNKLFTAATGLGSVINSSVTEATLGLGYNNASGEWNVAVADAIPVEKIGTGTLTIGANAANYAGDFKVLAGTAKLATGVTATKLGTVTVAKGATLDIRGATFACEKLVNNGVVLTDEGSSLVLNVDEDEAVRSGFAGKVEKRGAGTMTVQAGFDDVTELKVSEGTVRYLPVAFSGKYFKLVFVYGISGRDGITLGEFSLYDSAGRRVNQGAYTYNALPIPNKTEQYYGIDSLENIAEREVALMGAGGGYFHSHKSNEGPIKLFDGDSSTSFCIRYSWGNSAIGFRVPEASLPVVGYSMTASNSGYVDSLLNKWKLYGSSDGKNWTLLDDRSAEAQVVPTQRGAEYNDGVAYAFSSGVETDKPLLAAGGVVSVAKGAVLDLGDVGVGIEGLAIDCTAEAGAVTRFTPIANGAIYLTGLDQSALTLPCELPIEIGAMNGIPALRSWKVYVGGQLQPELRLRFLDGCLLLSGRGFCVIVR